MRLLGHPVHPMLVHFPIALWPAHWLLHLVRFAGSAPVAWWLLAAGCAIGWLSALAGGADLIAYWRAEDRRAVDAGLVHGIVNGTVLFALTIVAALEGMKYPQIEHGRGFLALEGALLVALFAGNYFGGRIRWEAPAQTP